VNLTIFKILHNFVQYIHKKGRGLSKGIDQIKNCDKCV
jgi:hypothetical protein